MKHCAKRHKQLLVLCCSLTVWYIRRPLHKSVREAESAVHSKKGPQVFRAVVEQSSVAFACIGQQPNTVMLLMGSLCTSHQPTLSINRSQGD